MALEGQDEDDVVAMLMDGDLPLIDLSGKKGESQLEQEFFDRLEESGQSKMAMFRTFIQIFINELRSCYLLHPINLRNESNLNSP